MLEKNENLKDSITGIGIALKDSQPSLPYNKTNKLVSALYMVTDIMDKEEPLRSKLRNLGINIVSDIHSIQQMIPQNHLGAHAGHIMSLIPEKVAEILSFLEIASSVSIISEMNCSILTKEFIELRKSIIEIAPKNEQVWLQEFMKAPTSEGVGIPTYYENNSVGKDREISIGQTGTRIGVQKGGNLMKALSRLGGQANTIKSESIDVLKNKRREEIVSIIKDKMKNSLNFDGVGIKDIVLALHSLGEDRGEKTLQRELVSMVSGGILKKTGEKRWSRYAIK